MKIVHFSELNKRLAQDTISFISSCDKEFDNSCLEIAEQIAEHKDEHPIILLSGPSGSGKTTTALKIESYLDNMGISTHTLSMDNYFLPKECIKLDKDERIDYESPYRIDISLLQDHMKRLAECEEIDLPAFDFRNQARVKGKKLRRERGELILFEGIHALNPEVTGYDDIASCIYVSVRTRIQLSNGELVHPELIRLMRRIIRDRNFRNRKPSETLDMFDSVQRGESLYINPYKDRAHYELDTFLGYETQIYKPLIEQDLEHLKNTYEHFDRFMPAYELIKDLLPADSSDLSETSMTREFIGGSSYEY